MALRDEQDRARVRDTAQQIAQRHGLRGRAILRALVEAIETGAREVMARAYQQPDGSRRGRKPYGYWEDERPVLETMQKLRDEGVSLARIAEALNAAGHCRRDGEPWTRFSVRAALE